MEAVRNSRDTHTRWVVAVVSAALVSMLGMLALFDRENINTTAHEGRAKSISNERRIDVLEERVDIRLKNIEGDVGEIKTLLQQQRD